MSGCDICYIISLGFSARMVLQTELVKELNKAGFGKISIIIPGKDDGSFKEVENRLGIKVYFIDVKSTFWSNEYMNFRKYVYEDIRNNPALLSKHLKSMENRGSNPWRIVRPYIYFSLNRLTRKFNFLKGPFKVYENFMLRDRKLKKLIKEINPKVVVSTYPVNFIEGSTLRAGKDLGITTVTQLLSWDNITCKGSFPVVSDYFIAWGDIMKNELMEYYGASSEKIFKAGVPHFDKSKSLVCPTKNEGYLKDMGLDPAKPYLFFGMSSPYFAPREIDVVERLADLISRDIFGEDMQMVIRPHPQNVEGGMEDKSWLPRLERLKGKRVGVNYPITEKNNLPWNVNERDLGMLSNLLAGSSVVINSGSTLSIEGMIHNKPIILTLFDGDSTLKEYNSVRRLSSYFHLRKLIDTKGVKAVYHYEDLKKKIIAAIEDPDSNKDLREKALYMECGKIDGKSCERIAESFKKIIPENN